jgi:two-component system, OmpR family, response regulator
MAACLPGKPEEQMGDERMGKPKVLLVDDEMEFVSTLAERLSLRGFDARMALSGEEALRLVASDPPQVVVLDTMMPGTRGLDVLKRLKREYPEIEVILLTGNISTTDGAEGMRHGAFDYLFKPLSIDELVETLRKAMDHPAG